MKTKLLKENGLSRGEIVKAFQDKAYGRGSSVANGIMSISWTLSL